MSDRRRFVVTVEPGCSLPAIADKLRDRGLQIEAVLAEIGCIIILADDRDMSALPDIAGIAAVEKEGDVDVGPPGDSDSW